MDTGTDSAVWWQYHMDRYVASNSYKKEAASMKIKKALLCGLVLLCMVFLWPHEASAMETSGTCGENLTWEYDAE